MHKVHTNAKTSDLLHNLCGRENGKILNEQMCFPIRHGLHKHGRPNKLCAAKAHSFQTSPFLHGDRYTLKIYKYQIYLIISASSQNL